VVGGSRIQRTVRPDPDAIRLNPVRYGLLAQLHLLKLNTRPIQEKGINITPQWLKSMRDCAVYHTRRRLKADIQLHLLVVKLVITSASPGISPVTVFRGLAGEAGWSQQAQ